MTTSPTSNCVTTMDVLTVITTLLVCLVTNFLFGPAIDSLRSRALAALRPHVMRAQDELTALRVRFRVWVLTSYATRPVTLQGAPELVAAFAYRSYGERSFIDGDLADPADFEESVRMAIPNGRSGDRIVEDITWPLGQILRALVALSHTKTFTINAAAATGLADVLDYDADIILRPEFHARLALIIWKGLFARGKPLYFAQARAQVRISYMTQGERSLLVRTLVRPEDVVRPHTLEQACAMVIRDHNDHGALVEEAKSRVEEIVEALAGFRRLEEDSLMHRVLERNLERIKARLWRPNGRLARRMLEAA